VSTLPTIRQRRVEWREQPHEVLELTFSNGAERTFYRMAQQGTSAVMIVAMPDAETVLLTREYAAGLHRYVLGLPRGRIDEGEAVLDAALRELKEEVGYGAHQLTQLRPLALAPSYMSHQIELVLAESLYPERLEGDEPEPIEVIPVALADLPRLALDADFAEGRALGALLVVMGYLAERAEST